MCAELRPHPRPDPGRGANLAPFLFFVQGIYARTKKIKKELNEMKNNNTNTAANTKVTAKGILALADKAEYQTAVAYHEMWELAKAELSRDDQTIVWEGLRDRSVEHKLGHFAGKKFHAAHPEIAPSKPAWAGEAKKAPAEQEKPKAAKKPSAKKAAPAKQETKPKATKAPAKQEKPKAANDMTTKEALGRIFETLVVMDKRLTAIEKKIAK
jgi:hypothetical protein